ncbi:DNA-binding protein [Edwardsiella tarda]|uniref:DNA-binding protein n=1 Tax=Edwardsiella tarda TaxID=636 RepID=UPI0024440367|nr:DNA-binding protein [Edwardsiella tarda]WGE29436.1 DNA-binding protein [Edwardsiella tarda]
MKNLWSTEEVHQLENMLNEGKSTTKIAAVLGRSASSVRQKKYHLGLRTARNYDRWDIDMAKALHAEGLTMRDIAEKLELKLHQIQYIIKEK